MKLLIFIFGNEILSELINKVIKYGRLKFAK